MRFQARDFPLDDAPQSGRPVEVDSYQIETLTENNQRYTTWEMANILKISKSIKLLVKMKNVSFILWKKPYRLFGPTKTPIPESHRERASPDGLAVSFQPAVRVALQEMQMLAEGS